MAKGLVGDEMGERVHLIVDGIDGRVHHMEFEDPSRIEEVGRDMIVEAAAVVFGPRAADRNIAANAEEHNDIYRPSRHLERVRDSSERKGKAGNAESESFSCVFSLLPFEEKFFAAVGVRSFPKGR